MKIIFIFFSVLFFHSLIGQNSNIGWKNGKVIILSQYKPAEFPGGKGELYKFINKNIHVPDSIKNGLMRGNANIEIKIDTNGNIIDQKVNSYCIKCKQEALKVVAILPKFNPAENNKVKTVSTYSFDISFRPDPDSIIPYKPEYLIGNWTIQGESKIKCPECPTISFYKNMTAKLISDSIDWNVTNKKMTFINKGNPTRQIYFLTNSTYSMKFKNFFTILVIENSKEKYTLYKQ